MSTPKKHVYFLVRVHIFTANEYVKFVTSVTPGTPYCSVRSSGLFCIVRIFTFRILQLIQLPLEFYSCLESWESYFIRCAVDQANLWIHFPFHFACVQKKEPSQKCLLNFRAWAAVVKQRVSSPKPSRSNKFWKPPSGTVGCKSMCFN